MPLFRPFCRKIRSNIFPVSRKSRGFIRKTDNIIKISFIKIIVLTNFVHLQLKVSFEIWKKKLEIWIEANDANYAHVQGSRNFKKVGSQQKFLVANKILALPSFPIFEIFLNTEIKLPFIKIKYLHLIAKCNIIIDHRPIW